jgi:hypothetical protein
MNRFVTSCLAKSPLVRPSVDSARKQLTRMKNPDLRKTGEGALRHASGLLTKAAEELERKRADEEARVARNKGEVSFRRDAASAALEKLVSIFGDLARTIHSEAPNAKATFPKPALTVTLGDASIVCDVCVPVFGIRNSSFDWDVLAAAFIGASEGLYTHERGRRSANLWFASFDEDSQYRWIEAGYMYSPDCPDFIRMDSLRKYVNPEPFGMSDLHSSEFQAPGLGLLRENRFFTLAYNPRPIDGEHLEDFCYRWTEHLAKAALRRLDRPEHLPEEKIRWSKRRG